MPDRDDLALLTEAAEAAGKIARRYFRREIKTWEKPDSAGPVTEADMEVDTMLREHLLGARPGYGWLSEETPDAPARLDARRVFIVDPIDGTRAFIEGSRAWAHSLAVVEDGIVIAATVYLPANHQLYTAVRGGGATLNGRRMRVTGRDVLDGASVLASRVSFEPWHWVRAEVPQIQRQFRSSLAYRMSLVGEGRYDAMLSLRPTWEWDVAAGSLLVEEAGGQVSDRRGNRLRFNNTAPQVNGVVAGPPMVQEEIARRLI